MSSHIQLKGNLINLTPRVGRKRGPGGGRETVFHRGLHCSACSGTCRNGGAPHHYHVVACLFLLHVRLNRPRIEFKLSGAKCFKNVSSLSR